MPENNKEKETEKKETIEQTAKKELEKIPESKEIKEIIAKLPPETIQRFTALYQSERIGPFPDPIIAKLTPEHITKIIECTDDDSKRNYNFSRIGKAFNFLYFLIGLGFLIFIIVFLADKEDFLKDILLATISFIGGIGAGIGYKTIKSR